MAEESGRPPSLPLSAQAPGRQVAAGTGAGAGTGHGTPLTAAPCPVLSPPLPPPNRPLTGRGHRGAARHVDGGCRQLRREGGGAGREEAAEALLRLPRDQESAGRLVRGPQPSRLRLLVDPDSLGEGGGSCGGISPSGAGPVVELMGLFSQSAAPGVALTRWISLPALPVVTLLAVSCPCRCAGVIFGNAPRVEGVGASKRGGRGRARRRSCLKRVNEK